MKLPDLRLFKQSFVSVVITPTKLQVVKLNKSLNRVEIAAQSKIPPGVIANYRVKNHESLVNILKELWSKNKIKEKYVGVVVPEFSTYSKIIELPNLTDTEITEALEWQVQDFLPAPIDEVVLDWKVVSREKTRIQLLVVAVLKDVLIGYIDAIGEAGLSPLVVETPSLSVDRIVDANGTGKMIIYMSAPEALLVISQNHKIVASSVVSANNFNIVVNTALQMMSHYKEAQVENIILAGTGIGQDLIQHLHYNLGKSVTFLDKKIPGLDPAAIQDYLIAISMQYKDPAEPDDDTTINLLPPSWADFYEQKHLKIQSWTLTLIVSIILWTTFLSAMIVFTTLGVQSESLSRDLESEGVTGLRESINEVKANKCALQQDH